MGKWIRSHKVVSSIFALLLIIVIAAASASSSHKAPHESATAGTTVTSGVSASTANSSTPPTTAPPTTTTAPARHVVGTATTLGAGNFSVGTAVAPGLYDVTAAPGETGNFIVNGPDTYNEILGSGTSGSVPKVRVRLSRGDTVQLSGLSQVHFAPVRSPFVTTQSPVTLYAGTWTVGQDLGPGRYVATPGPGQSGNFIIDAQGVNEILGGASSLGAVPNVTFSVQNGDVIEIFGLAQVTLTPQ